MGKWIAVLAAALTSCAVLASAAQAWPVYVDVNEANRIEVIDSTTNQLTGTSFETAPVPQRLTVSPDGRQLYLAHTGQNYVTVIDTANGHEVGEPIPVGEAPVGIAITPDGRFAYVADNNSSQVSVIDTAAHRVVKTIDGFEIPPDVAVAPDGGHAYVANASGDDVSVIDTATNQLVGAPIPVGKDPDTLAFTPDGRYLFVACSAHEEVVVIDPALGIVVGSPIPVGDLPSGIAITPDGSTAYVTNFASQNVTAIDTATRQVKKTIEVGHLPAGVAVTPDGRFVYVADDGIDEAVSVIDPSSNEVATTIEEVGHRPEDVVVAPDQPPRASFTAPAAVRPGVAVAFNAAGSSDPDGTIGSYAWSFGDGSGASGPVQSHAFAAPGTYTVTLTEADTIGCSTQPVYTGHESLCNGGPGAVHTQNVTVAFPSARLARPRVRVACPKRALKKPGCTVKLAAVARKGGKAKGGKHRRKPRLTFESAVAKAKLAPGASASLAIVPKPRFAAALDGATVTLVREVLDFKTKSGHQHQVKVTKKPVF